jgi:hypothetical protein
MIAYLMENHASAVLETKSHFKDVCTTEAWEDYLSKYDSG